MTHRLLLPAESLNLGETTDLRQVFTQYLTPELRNNKRRRTTVKDIERHTAKFCEWWATITDQILPVARIDRRHLIEFRDWLLAEGHTNCNTNRHLGTVRQLLRCAERNQIIEHAPRIESLPHRSVAPKVYIDNDQVSQLWEAAPKLDWPRRTTRKERLHYEPGDGWRAALILLRTYGFRTQELISLESRYRSLAWANVFGPGMTPNPEGRCVSDIGWISYVPQKQERVKPEPLVVPLTKHTAAALRVLGWGQFSEDTPVFDWVRSSTSFRSAWAIWMVTAGITPREASGVKKFTPKHFRKTATSYLNLHRSGMAQHIVGHGSDRSGQISVISSKHYDNAEAGVLETLESFPQPECFDEFLS